MTRLMPRTLIRALGPTEHEQQNNPVPSRRHAELASRSCIVAHAALAPALLLRPLLGAKENPG